jgi:hypothetical protein
MEFPFWVPGSSRLRKTAGNAEDAATYVWHASQRQIEVERAKRNCGILVQQQIIWVKNKPVLTCSFYMSQDEPRFFGWK